MISADTLGNMIPQIEFRIQNDGLKAGIFAVKEIQNVFTWIGF